MSDEERRMLTPGDLEVGMAFESPACAGYSKAIEDRIVTVRVLSAGEYMDFREPTGLTEKTIERMKRAADLYSQTPSLTLHQLLKEVAPVDTLKAFFPKPVYRLRMIVKAGEHVGYQVFQGDWLHSYQWFDGNQPAAPKFCAANRDGECTHPGCPQLAKWQNSCPIPDYPEEG